VDLATAVAARQSLSSTARDAFDAPPPPRARDCRPIQRRPDVELVTIKPARPGGATHRRASVRARAMSGETGSSYDETLAREIVNECATSTRARDAARETLADVEAAVRGARAKSRRRGANEARCGEGRFRSVGDEALI
tara:strand:+ start:2170 stop:2586 length:417 start_codon:yes stop_codon:yes gene_type:complete